MVSVKEGGDPQRALNIGEFGSSAIMVVVSKNTVHSVFFGTGHLQQLFLGALFYWYLGKFIKV